MNSEIKRNDLGPQFVSDDRNEGAGEQDYTEKKR
jgi:hypothetical protein